MRLTHAWPSSFDALSRFVYSFSSVESPPDVESDWDECSSSCCVPEKPDTTSLNQLSQALPRVAGFLVVMQT